MKIKVTPVFMMCEGCHKNKIVETRIPTIVGGEEFRLCGSCEWRCKLRKTFDNLILAKKV